jgi:hypothetical protein
MQGCGVVEFETAENAQNAIAMFNGYQVCMVACCGWAGECVWEHPGIMIAGFWAESCLVRGVSGPILSRHRSTVAVT